MWKIKVIPWGNLISLKDDFKVKYFSPQKDGTMFICLKWTHNKISSVILSLLNMSPILSRLAASTNRVTTLIICCLATRHWVVVVTMLWKKWLILISRYLKECLVFALQFLVFLKLLYKSSRTLEVRWWWWW